MQNKKDDFLWITAYIYSASRGEDMPGKRPIRALKARRGQVQQAMNWTNDSVATGQGGQWQ